LTKNTGEDILRFIWRNIMGYVYIFQNDWMPNIIKIGITDDLEKRLKESAGNEFVPCAFSCYYAIQSDKNDKLEKFIHKTYDMFRVNDKREFFELDVDTAKTMLQGLVDIGVATEIDDSKVQQISQSVSSQLTQAGVQTIIRKRSRTTFKMLNIQIGTELIYKNDESIKCLTVDDINLIEFEGEKRTISNLSDKLAGYTTSGFEYFKLNGKTLADIRREIEGN
jgi:hypothetical protein